MGPRKERGQRKELCQRKEPREVRLSRPLLQLPTARHSGRNWLSTRKWSRVVQPNCGPCFTFNSTAGNSTTFNSTSGKSTTGAEPAGHS